MRPHVFEVDECLTWSGIVRFGSRVRFTERYLRDQSPEDRAELPLLAPGRVFTVHAIVGFDYAPNTHEVLLSESDFWIHPSDLESVESTRIEGCMPETWLKPEVEYEHDPRILDVIYERLTTRTLVPGFHVIGYSPQFPNDNARMFSGSFFPPVEEGTFAFSEHGFCFHTRDHEVITRFEAVIKQNYASDAYKARCAEREAQLAQLFKVAQELRKAARNS